jgi:sulfite exporter TauE/SafE
MPPADRGLRTDHGPRPAGAQRPRKVVIWQHDQARVQHDVIGLGDVQSDTEYGRLLVRSLTRAQLGLSLMCLALAGAVIASFPVIMALLPSARKATVAGLPITLLVLGAGIFPVLMAIGWFYNRQASQLEARFIDLVDPAGRRLE